jgi:uncharacterized protein YjcR
MRKPKDSPVNLTDALQEIDRLRRLNEATLKFAQANMERADQQQQILHQHEQRISILEAYIRGQNEQN